MKKEVLYKLKAKQLIENIRCGKYGLSGELFITTRELAKKINVSLVTAQKIMCILKNEMVVELIGKKYYLNYGVALPDSSIYKVLPSNDIIGIHVPNIESPYFSELVYRLEKSLRDLGYNVIVNSSHFDSDDEKRIIKQMQKMHIKGLISCPGRSENLKDLYLNLNIPLVFLSSIVDGVPADAVLVNNYSSSKMVAKHLVSQGYEEFAYLGPNKKSDIADERYDGYSTQLKNEGKDLKKEDVYLFEPNEHEKITATVYSRVKNLKKSLGIFCYSDLIAVDALKGLKRAGVNVPKEVGLVGFDNLQVTELIQPSISTVHSSVMSMVKNVIDRLLYQIKHPDKSNERIYVEPALIIRESSKKQSSN